MGERSKKKKIKLQKKTGPIHTAKVKTGFTMPVGMVSEDSLISFRDWTDLKKKYFTFKGRIARKPFILRMLIISFAQFIMTLILLNRLIEALSFQMVEIAGALALVFLVLSIPMILSQFSLGWRRLHDMNMPGFVFVIPYAFYIASFLTTAYNMGIIATAAQAIAAVMYIALFSVKGTEGDNAYAQERAR